METHFMLNIVVARRGEELRWIDDLPEHCTVTVYSDDASLGIALDVTRPVDLVRLPGMHQVSELYLAHLARPVIGGSTSHTVFTPGDPLAVCPDFLALLEATELWHAVQPLTQSRQPGTSPDTDSTPPHDWLAGLPVSPVHFDLRSWAPLGGFDRTLYRARQRYRQAQKLSVEQHPAVHFLQACHLDALARTVAEHDLGVRDSGRLFAVQQSRLVAWQSEHAPVLPQVAQWLREDPSHIRIWDQFWLHLFGLPLVRLDTPAPPPTASRADADTDANDPWPEEDFSLSRALATIDDTLARLAPPPLSQQRGRPSALQIARAAALHERQPDASAPARLTRAERKELEALSERAAQAFRAGDLQYAVACARLALQQAEQHMASRFTLAMALAALGQREQALEQFERMLQTEGLATGSVRVPDRTVVLSRPQ
jgi:hypothetical protein